MAFISPLLAAHFDSIDGLEVAASLPDDSKVSQPVLYRRRRSDDLETDDYWDDVDPLTDHIAGTAAASVPSAPSVPSVASVPTTDEIVTDSKLTWKNIVGASRPPMWFASAFSYTMCVSDPAVYQTFCFWAGLMFCTLPFNLLLCGLNDVADWDVDHINPKRQSAWRRVLSPPQLAILGRIAVLSQLPFGAYMAYLALQESGQADDAAFDGDAEKLSSATTIDPTSDPAGILEADPLAGICHVALWWFSTAFQISLYNGFGGMWQLSRVPLVDLPMNVWAWLLPLHLSCLINDSVSVDVSAVVFWSLQLVSGQIIAATHDIASDCAGKKFTTATLLGKHKAILMGASAWVLQSVWAASLGLVPPLLAAAHLAVGAGMFVGALHIKYAYPCGFLFDVGFLLTSLPEGSGPTAHARAAVLFVSASAILTSMPLPGVAAQGEKGKSA